MSAQVSGEPVLMYFLYENGIWCLMYWQPPHCAEVSLFLLSTAFLLHSKPTWWFRKINSTLQWMCLLTFFLETETLYESHKRGKFKMNSKEAKGYIIIHIKQNMFTNQYSYHTFVKMTSWQVKNPFFWTAYFSLKSIQHNSSFFCFTQTLFHLLINCTPVSHRMFQILTLLCCSSIWGQHKADSFGRMFLYAYQCKGRI